MKIASKRSCQVVKAISACFFNCFVSATAFNDNCQVEFGFCVVDYRDDQLWVDHFNFGVFREICSCDGRSAPLASVNSTGFSLEISSSTDFRFNMISTTSSLMPGIVVNSCETPSILKAVIAASIELREHGEASSRESVRIRSREVQQ